MTLTPEESTKRIEVLERKIAREKKARSLAENQLEVYSREIYEANISLKSALSSSERQQAELEYLGKASAYVASELPLKEMTSNMVELTTSFCSASYGFYLVTKDDAVVAGKVEEVWNSDKSWHKEVELCQLVTKHLPINDAEALESWLLVPINTADEDGAATQSITVLKFPLSADKLGWIGFLGPWQEIDTQMQSVLGTARGHFLSGIRRRLTDLRILKRNVQLQDSVTKLETAKKQLIQSEKMASLGQLAAGVAHEINNPVGFIRSNMEVLKQYLDDYKLLHDKLQTNLTDNGSLSADFYNATCSEIDLPYVDEDSRELLISNIDGLNRVKKIVDNLKSFSHSGSGELAPISLGTCIESSLKVASNAFKYEHKIDNLLTDSCPLVLGDSGQLQQVFINLFVNAAYAMEGGGTLSISHTLQDNKVAIHITDTGSGMDEATIAKLFTPFFTTKPVGVGTGLGLSVSYAILEAHNAEVVVDSEVGVGTTFNVLFPMQT